MIKKEIKKKEQYPKIYFEPDSKGKHKVIEYSNGIKVRLLKEPSKEYINKHKGNKKEYSERLKQKQEKANKEKLIQKKIREIAERELKEEGKI